MYILNHFLLFQAKKFPQEKLPLNVKNSKILIQNKKYKWNYSEHYQRKSCRIPDDVRNLLVGKADTEDEFIKEDMNEVDTKDDHI